MGTATFVTNSQAEATQFFLNLPFGETMLEQTDGSYDNPFKFNAKELDDDTGLYYYGARYYNPRLSIWYGVDPLAVYNPVMESEFYGDGQHNGGVFFWGNNNPYIYTYQNPIVYIDPNGKQVKVTGRVDSFSVDFSKNKHGVFENWDENATLYGKRGTLLPRNFITQNITVYEVQKALGTNLVPNDDGEYINNWQDLTNMHPAMSQQLGSNCYGWALTGGKYYINAETYQIANYLQFKGYKNLGSPTKNTQYKIGDILLWDGHIMKATGENKEGIIWDSKLGTGTVERGALKDILKINSDSSPDFGKADKAILLRKTISEKKLKQ
ncbi:RHS repeat-associated core domain-containing protein [Chryseobacterium sp. Ch-15]|uniref:RHS repeat-associated core domain-containing protein n=1 Tax=Chryseobacterium muglaense TaxID=2893752 RepID=A0A9Q3YXN9_9FLAO|nr:RHS repeat-associated core domain-containing protein [Chryseobacterium muglaense]MBD3906416.1 RHS repeat-associated core domain-containing protein [Chryseobacterium muglaense]MCC9037075.1 RHS repeat-associated core domain-containing protein [Chryseobacterium muglaense]MCM2556634.1 RHS repeat-associated core domain-containing protein [Chryseobacterium muglaense]